MINLRSITWSTFLLLFDDLIQNESGLRMNLEKTVVMWIGEQEVDLHVVVDGKTIFNLNK